MTDLSEGFILDHPPTAAELELLSGVCQESDDPASPYYKRVLVRPCLHIWRVLGWALLVLCIAFLAAVGVYFLSYGVLWAVLTGVGVVIATLICFAKRVLIWLVKVYQKLAPAKVRNRCRFEPSCSQYMILALEKYGFWKGLRKGLGRIHRCKPPHGGHDEP